MRKFQKNYYQDKLYEKKVKFFKEGKNCILPSYFVFCPIGIFWPPIMHITVHVVVFKINFIFIIYLSQSWVV